MNKLQKKDNVKRKISEVIAPLIEETSLADINELDTVPFLPQTQEEIRQNVNAMPPKKEAEATIPEQEPIRRRQQNQTQEQNLPKPQIIQLKKEMNKPATNDTTLKFKSALPIPSKPTNENEINKKGKLCFNILLLGPTGTGKSTLINSIANYLMYPTFQEALKNKVISLIPTDFPITCVKENGEFEDIRIVNGGTNSEDINEPKNDAMSCTTIPKVYDFYGEDIEYHIIDVPGIGDTGGVEKDKINKPAILKKLKEFDVIHAIFIVINSTTARLTIETRNNYNEILMELHKNAIPNIMFILTTSRTTNFQPGDAINPLTTYTEELQARNIKIKIDNNTLFCIDNEGYRYQCGIQNEIYRRHFSKDEKIYENSWNQSKNAILKAFKIIANLPKHKIKYSIEISEARIMIQNLMGPLAKVFTFIQKEMSEKMKEAQIINIMETGMLIQKDVTVEKLEIPRCVCLTCAEKTSIPGTNEIQINFTQICHNECFLLGTTPDKFPEPKLKECEAFDESGICKNCPCHYRKHIRISENITQKQVLQFDGNFYTRKQAENLYQRLLQILQSEQRCMWESIIELTHFLKNNAVVDFNQQFEDKLKMEIELESVTNPNSDIVDRLKKRLACYHDEMAVMKRALKKQDISSKDVTSIRNKLFEMKINGELIKKLYEANCVNFNRGEI